MKGGEMGYVLKILRQLRSSKIYPEGTVSSVLNMSKKQNVFFFYYEGHFGCTNLLGLMGVTLL